MSDRPVVWIIGAAGADMQQELGALDAFGARGHPVEAESPHRLGARLGELATDLLPSAVKIGRLGSLAEIEAVVRWIDRLRERSPALAVVVDPVLEGGGGFADEGMRRICRDQLLPRATLVTATRAEAAALLDVPPLQSPAQIEQSASMLCEAGAAAVAITGGDTEENTYVDAPWARGWLRTSGVTPHRPGVGRIFASSTAAALALGFVEIEAAVLAQMALAGGEGAGPGFSNRIENLPEFVSAPGATQPSFAPLRDPDLGLYAIVDSAQWVERVLAAGVRTVQLRIKDASHPRLREEVRRAVAASDRMGAQLFINDHWRLAIEERAYGVHLGQEDLGEADLDAIARAGLRLGVSTHAYWEVCRAWSCRPSYIACGPIHPTASKAMPWIPQGNGNLAYWCRLLPVPVVAIAGMDGARGQQARECGAAGVAVMTGITAAGQPESVIRALLERLGSAASLCQDPPRLPSPTLKRVARGRV